MKISKLIIFLQLLLLQTVLSAQVQWYQSQDSHNPPPNGTVGVSVQSLTPNSFVACYQWSISNDQFTWKISKSHINGTEQRSFFVTGTTAQVEVKVGHHNSVYVFERNFPVGQNFEYTVFKLDTNLVVRAQKSIEFPNGFNIFNMNAFELDNSDNVYFAGDGQYPAGPGFNPASFVLKMDKNFVMQWNRMDSTQTSFTRLHVDRSGNVIVLADFYTFFPDVRITRISSNGVHAQTSTIHTNAGRFNLFSSLDDDDNLLLYGGNFIGDTAQAVFLYKISRVTGRIVFSKTLFTAIASQLNDLKIDAQGNIFTLSTQYFTGSQVSKVSRINPNNGNIYWNHSFNFAHDSCNLSKLVINEDDQFFVVGQRISQSVFSKAFAVRMRKNGLADNNYFAPDSVAFQRSHWLTDGISDRNNQLIAIGSTEDLDPVNNTSSYFRSFAVKYGTTKNNNGCDNRSAAENTEEDVIVMPDELGITTPDDHEARMVDNVQEIVQDKGPELNKLIMYPNPAKNQLTLINLDPSVYDKLAVYNMQGKLLFQQNIEGATARMNTTSLTPAVYLVVLRSSITSNEKSMKFVVGR